MARLTAVDYDPFASGPSLTPVDYDPFAPALNARASGSAGVEAPKSAWVDETMGQYTRDRAGIAKLEEEAKAAGVPLGRAVKWKRNQLERQDREGVLQAPTTAPLSLGDANEGSVNERAAIIRAAEQVQSSPLATWPNTGSKTSIPGEGDDAELTSALDVLENYRKRVSPEVPGPQFMRQMFPRGTAQEAAKDPDGSWGAAGESMLQGVRQSVAGGAQAIGERLRYAGNSVPAIRDAINVPANALRVAGYEQGAESLARMSELGAGLAQRPTGSVYDDPDGWARYLGQQGVAGSGPTLVGMGAGLVNPVLGAATFMGSAAGSEYGRARIEDSATPSEAGVRAITAAATEGIPEAIGGAAMLGRLPLMKLAQSTARGRAAIAMPVEAGTEALTEKANIELERARGKYISPEEESRRIQDAAVIGGVMGGTIGAGTAVAEGGTSGLTNIRETIRQASSAADISSPMAAAFTRAAQATTARILPNATPDAIAGAAIADDAFRSAGVGTVAATDMAEQDALARDLDAAQLDQLGSEAEIDRLLTGNAPRERTDLYRASIPGAIPQGVHVSTNQDAFAAPGTIGGRDAPAPIQVTTLPDRSVFVPGDPVAIRQKLADAGSQWQGMAQERDGVAGVRFSPTSWTDVQGLIGGSIAPTANVAPEVAEAPAAAPPLDLTARRTNSDTKFDERVHDLADFVALNGGLDRSALEAEGIDPANWNSRKAKAQNDKFFGKPLFRKTGGMTLETLREKARDAGFRTDKDVLDLISDSLGGRKTFTPAGSEYQMALADVARQEADAQARQQRVNALPLSVPETDADAYIASRETEFDAPADRDGADLADIESTLASVADTSPQQRASVVSLGHDYTAKLIELKRARAAGALNPDQQEAYIDLLEQDRETGKVAGRPMIGIGNKTAYVDALMQGKLMPVQVFLDADNFKALNDKFGHDVGDDAIRLIADVVRAEFGDGNVFHRGGDEFLTQGMTQEEVDAKMARVQDYLARVKMELPLSDGRTATLTGVGVSYGTGANEKAADDSLKQDKQRRKDAGLRFDRREGDDAGRVGSQSSGAGTEASGANSRDSSRAAAEGVGDGQPAPANDRSRPVPNEAESGMRGERGTASDAGTVQSIRAAISQALGPKFLARLDNQKWFQIVDSVADLPPDVRKSITGEGVAGFVLPDGRVFIVAEGAAANPVGVTLHELGVHYGMTGILGEDFAPTLAKFRRLRAKDDRVGRSYERATEAADKDANGELTADALATLDEEALAYYVEANWNTPDARGIVAKVIDAIKSLLNRLGIPLSTLNASPEMLRKVAIGAARKAADGRVSVGKDGALRYHKAWHGSPHDFDKFRLDNSTIGTGEGAQAYGYGLYMAGSRDVADHYRKALSGRRSTSDLNGRIAAIKVGGKPLGEDIELDEKLAEIAEGQDQFGAWLYADEKSKHWSDLAGDESYPFRDYAKAHAKAWSDLVAALQGGSEISSSFNGRLYEVELAPQESDYLDWDAPLSEQSDNVLDALEQFGDTPRDFEKAIKLYEGRLGLEGPRADIARKEIEKLRGRIAIVATGEQFYRRLSGMLGGDREASRALHAAGIPGIRYLDGSSRGGKTGWRVKFKNGQYSGKVFDTKAEADAAVERGEYNMVDRVEKIDDLSHNFVIFDDSQVEVKAKYSRRAGGGSVGNVKTVDVGGFDLPLNPNGTVTLYHHTNEDAAAKIRETGVLRSAGEPTVYVTTEREPTTGYGDAVVAIEVDPRKLSPDDEFPGGRVDFSLDVGRPGGSLRVKIAKDDTRQAPPREGLGASGDTDARIAYSRRTAEPEGLPPPVAIESHLSNMLKLRAFWDSAVDVMARQPGLKPLADAVRSYFDNVRRRQGLVNEVLRAPVKAASKADLDAFERYQYALQNNLRADVSEELAGMTDKGRALVSAWEKVAKLTNDENQKVGVQVFDPKIGGWRKIGTARNFFPRVLKPMFQEAMRQPHKYPTEWNRLVRILLDAGRIQSAEDAQEFLNTAFSNESAFEYFAGIEKARMEPLPRDLYDYSMDAAIGYKDAWADRLSQIEAFGQKIGQGDQAKDKFDEVLMTVTDDNTRNYVTRVRERITNTNSKSPFYKFMANMNTLVTGLMLGNPATAALNIVGGLSNNAMVFPIGPNLKALKELRKLGDGIRDAVAKGVLIDDYMGVSADAAAQGVSERLSNLTQGLLNWGGYNGTEYINRVHSMLVGKHFLSDSLAAINKNPRSRKSLLATAFLQRNGFDIDTLAAESTKPADERPETNKFLRFASNLTQGSYKIDQTPIFVDEPIGKFLFKYQKFGTQINRVFYQQVLKPFAQSVFRGGEPVTLKNADGTEAQERVRNFVPLLRFIAAAIPGGMLVQFIREALFGYGEDGPDEDEIRRKLADGETAAAAAMLAERAFIAITALGAGGFLGNYMQTAKDFQERQRYKNPMDPPGLAPVKSFVNFVMKLNDQGKITMDDVEQEIQNNVSLYRTTKRLLSSGINMVSDESVTFAAREAARREHNHVRYMARRYADSVGIEAKRRAPSEIATTANTPTNRAIKDALLLGDGETARALAAEYVASFDNAYDAANALASIRNSIRLGQPALVQLAPSETERRRFMRWAFSNLTPEGYARIKETDEKYRKAAASSGLWKPESDAAAMKRDRKADESKAQWSDSQRNSFLRSKGLKR